MGFNLAVYAMRVLEAMFFAGLSGCIVVVIISWLSVGKDSFSERGQ